MADVDPEKTASTLLRAATLGLPFCEECQKAEYGADSIEDAAAQCEALLGAAESGVPFCEACENTEAEEEETEAG